MTTFARHCRRTGFLLPLVLAAAAGLPARAALTPEQATQVGGTLGEAGTQLAALQAAALKVAEAAPRTASALGTALGRIANAPGAHSFGQQLWLLAFALLLVAALVAAFRGATRRTRAALASDAQPARGAGLQLALDTIERAIVAVAAYLLVESVFTSEALQDLFALALLWAGVRWWIAMLLVEALLRPSRAQFRLIAMSDAAARQVKWIVGATVLAGFTGISVMPVLLRAGLPVPAGQVLALVQGTVVAAGCAAALWRYRVSRSAPASSIRWWSLLAGCGVALLWTAWGVSVLRLDFAVYHAFTWSMRIGALAYLAHSLLGLSANARWILLLQRSITAAAILGIAILMAEVWLVERLQLVSREEWASTRQSLVAAAATLCGGYIVWRFLLHWTEERLRATAPAGPGESAKIASRLTTVLPMLRILAGTTILVVTVLLALSQLGVQITPLLAGAGVVGLAISFGAQTLVKDIITGAFFLVDDAFRVGEYIVSGSYKGNVEAITLRSVKLRHHRGPVYTVPFGELRAIQNMSRDWVIDKFSVGITYDSDLEKARRLVKEIGKQLAADPEHAPHILEPLKMQGVEQFGDFAVQVRVKMKTRPGEQFVIRRKANALIKKAFDENGIRFAFPTVQVAGGANGGDGSAAAARQGLALTQPPASGSS
jgi:moderate conductance mechanosensitive channel